MSYVTPDYLTQYHENLIKSFNIKYKNEDTGYFTISQPEKASPDAWGCSTLDVKGSSWLIDNISLLDITGAEGTTITIGDGSLYTGRAKEGRFHKKLKTNGTPFLLSETDSCASLTYEEMAVMANAKNFNNEMIAFFKKSVVRDMLRDRKSVV